MVSALVGDSCGQEYHILEGSWLFEVVQEIIIEGHQSGIFHGFDLEFRAEDRVILEERKGNFEGGLIELQREFGDFEEEGGGGPVQCQQS